MKTNENQDAAEGGSLRRRVRHVEPTVDGIYRIDATGAMGWKGPSGMVEIVTYPQNRHPWNRWCYWLPDDPRKPATRPRCGIPVSFMRGAMWWGPLKPNLPLCDRHG